MDCVLSPRIPSMRFAVVSLLCIGIWSHLRMVAGHALLAIPNQRGSLASTPFVKGIDEKAPKDYKPHFPAGSKEDKPGAAGRSQIKAAGPAGWEPFRPLEKTFRWRSGVCGDLKGPHEAHRRGGRFYYGAKIVHTYQQGGILAAQVNMVSNHNGFFEFHICDVSKCGGEISEACFRQGHCQQMERAPNPACDDGENPLCGPIDRNYPGRWYVPCTRLPELTNYGREYLGGSTMLYKLPKDLSCEHCVLQWFWSAGNTCNAPGVIQYFDGPDRPRWGNCIGQGGAIGGVSRVQKPCGPDRFPGEFLQCADIAIEPKGLQETYASASAPGTTSDNPSPSDGPNGAQEGSQTGPIPLLDESSEDRPGGTVLAASPELDMPVSSEQPTELEETSDPNPASEESLLPTPEPAYGPSPSQTPDPTPPPTQELAIPDGYPMGIYPPKRGSRVLEWDNFRWAAAERSRRQKVQAQSQDKEESVVHGAPTLHEWDTFRWAAAERRRRRNFGQVETVRHPIVADRDPFRWARAERAKRRRSEENASGPRLIPHWDIFKWAKRERARSQQQKEGAAADERGLQRRNEYVTQAA